MSTQDVDPVLTVTRLLRNNSSRYDVNPDIHTGKYRENSSDPQIAVVFQEESPLNGGETGYAAINPTGKGGVQHLVGVIYCRCYDNYDRTNDVKSTTYGMKETSGQIIVDNQLDQDDLEWLGPGSAEMIVEDEDPVTVHYLLPVVYKRRRSPQ